MAFFQPHEDYLEVVRERYQVYGLTDEPLVRESGDREEPFLVGMLFISSNLMRGESMNRLLFDHK